MPETHDERPPASATPPRQPVENEILRPRPISSEIDHGALSYEFMARFPKIRAALAK
jgi:hypothetical protein